MLRDQTREDNMRKRVFGVFAVTILMIGAVLAATPSVGQADVIISSVSVAESVTTYTGSTAPGNTWNFSGIGPPTPITLHPGQSLVLTQNQANQGNSSLTNGLPGFNFDTSEANRGAAATQYTVTINGANAFL